MVADTGVALRRTHSKIGELKRINEAKPFLHEILIIDCPESSALPTHKGV